MKKRVLSFLLILVMSMLCIGCSKDADTNADQPVVDNNKQEVEQTVENTEEDTEDSIGRQKITDPQIVAAVTDLIKAEKEFVYELDCVWPENTKLYKINGKMYRIVDKEVATSWDDYAEAAKNYYTDEYVENEFTPYYTDLTKTFVEKKNRLYRLETTTEVYPLVEGSVEIFESTDGKLYVSFFEDANGDEWESACLVKAAEGKPYGYVIVEKIGTIK